MENSCFEINPSEYIESLLPFNWNIETNRVENLPFGFWNINVNSRYGEFWAVELNPFDAMKRISNELIELHNRINNGNKEV